MVISSGDEELGYWRGSLVLPSGRIARFGIAPATDEHAARLDAREVLAAARSVAAWLREAEAEVYAAVAAEMLPLYNGMWRDEPPITTAEFGSRIELVEVSLPSTGGM